MIEPTLVTELIEPGCDVLACGPEPMLEAVARARARRAARLGGADGLRLRRLLRLRGRDRRRAASASASKARCSDGCVRLLNASGCLDALTAPEVARAARRLRDEDGHAAAARGQRAAADRRDRRTGCSTRSGSPTRAASASSPRRCRGCASSASRSGSRSAASPRHEYARDVRPRSTSVEAIELNLSCPNVDEAAETRGRDRRRLPRGDRAAALREALAGAPGRRRTSPARSRRRAPTGSRSSTRSAASRSTRGRSARCSRPRPAGSPGPALKPVALAAVYACARGRPSCRSSAWAGSRPGATRSSCSRPARRHVALGTVLFARPRRAGPDPRRACASCGRARVGAPTSRDRPRPSTDASRVELAKNPWKSRQIVAA